MHEEAVSVIIKDLKGKLVHRSLHRFNGPQYINPFREAVAKIYPRSETYIVNIKHAKEPPKGFQVPRGKLWCPYCNEAREFPYDSYIGVERCQVCGISVRDFHIKTINDLWPKTRGGDEGGKKASSRNSRRNG